MLAYSGKRIWTPVMQRVTMPKALSQCQIRTGSGWRYIIFFSLMAVLLSVPYIPRQEAQEAVSHRHAHPAGDDQQPDLVERAVAGLPGHVEIGGAVQGFQDRPLLHGHFPERA